ncbi:hypothetical protein FGO68_gene14153 [Halteria grandinella]|uniref:Disease resistance R13L4/SHOC-2-like LRR domain-containing protein n=1 Tax=Halteria grandinella TaxID=5974 RepID=A0A8J8T8F0_HALGN|nr:hypothetical protein FGO68_gene14153 [Halteria grandinella]
MNEQLAVSEDVTAVYYSRASKAPQGVGLDSIQLAQSLANIDQPYEARVNTLVQQTDMNVTQNNEGTQNSVKKSTPKNHLSRRQPPITSNNGRNYNRNQTTNNILDQEREFNASDTMLVNQIVTLQDHQDLTTVYLQEFQMTYNYQVEQRTQREIRIVQKDIDCLPKMILQGQEFQNIRILDIQRNRLTELESAIFVALRSLQLLNASKNNIESVSCKISLCKELEKIILDDNQLRGLPDEICHLNALKVLSLHNNQIKTLPEFLSRLSNLTILNVSGNKLKRLPLGLGELEHLEDLQFQNNKIRFLNPEFHTMTELAIVGCDWFQYAQPALPVLSNMTTITEWGHEDFDDAQQIEGLKSLCEKITRANPFAKISLFAFAQHFSKDPTHFSLNTPSPVTGKTALHTAVLKNDHTTVQLLLECDLEKVNLNILDSEKYSALGIALREEQFRIAYMLMDQQTHVVDVGSGGGESCSLMHLAVAKLDVKSVIKLIMRKSPVNIKDTVTGDTPLHLLVNVFMKNAVAGRKILGFLIDAGMDPNQQNTEGWTPLHIAVKKGGLEIVEMLLSSRPSVGSIQYQVDINKCGGPQLNTPLHIACTTNLYRIVNLLLAYRADLFTQNLDGKTPLTIIQNNFLMLKLLKKAVTHSVRDIFEDHSKRPREQHLVSISLIQKLSDKYIFNGSSKGAKRSKRSQIASQTLRNNLKLLNHYLKFPCVLIDKATDLKFRPSIPYPSSKPKLHGDSQVVEYTLNERVFPTEVAESEEASAFGFGHRLNTEEGGIGKKWVFHGEDIKHNVIDEAQEYEQIDTVVQDKRKGEGPKFDRKKLSEVHFDRAKSVLASTNSIPQHHPRLSQPTYQSPHTNLFYLKEALLDKDFNIKRESDQVKTFIRFTQLYNPSKDKHIQTLSALIFNLSNYSYTYLQEQILSFVETQLLNVRVGNQRSIIDLRESLYQAVEILQEQQMDGLKEMIEDILTTTSQYHRSSGKKQKYQLGMTYQKVNVTHQDEPNFGVASSQTILKAQLNHGSKNPFKGVNNESFVELSRPQHLVPLTMKFRKTDDDFEVYRGEENQLLSNRIDSSPTINSNDGADIQDFSDNDRHTAANQHPYQSISPTKSMKTNFMSFNSQAVHVGQRRMTLQIKGAQISGINQGMIGESPVKQVPSGLPKLNLKSTQIKKPVENIEEVNEEGGASKKLFMEDLDREKVRQAYTKSVRGAITTLHNTLTVPKTYLQESTKKMPNYFKGGLPPQTVPTHRNYQIQQPDDYAKITIDDMDGEEERQQDHQFFAAKLESGKKSQTLKISAYNLGHHHRDASPEQSPSHTNNHINEEEKEHDIGANHDTTASKIMDKHQMRFQSPFNRYKPVRMMQQQHMVAAKRQLAAQRVAVPKHKKKALIESPSS